MRTSYSAFSLALLQLLQRLNQVFTSARTFRAGGACHFRAAQNQSPNCATTRAVNKCYLFCKSVLTFSSTLAVSTIPTYFAAMRPVLSMIKLAGYALIP